MNSKHFIGLTDHKVLKSREENGSNELKAPESDPAWKEFVLKFTGPFGHLFKKKVGPNAGEEYEDGDPLIFVLEIAAVLSILVSCSQYYGWFGIMLQGAEVFFEPLGILVAIGLATGLASYFEGQADEAFSALNEKNDEERVKVIRNGNETEVAKTEIVVGDIVRLDTGDEIPADGELLEAISLRVDESTLNGESDYAIKSINPADFNQDATYHTNCVLRSTKVMEGHGLFSVQKVGAKTEFGKIYEEAQIDDSVKTPLNEQLDGLGDWITLVSYVLAGLVVIGHIIWWFASGTTWDTGAFIAYVLQKLMVAVTLVVVAVPEGLPMAVTLSLAYSMRSMLKTNNLVRKMHACETMGATTVICTDKTGTLTQNKMQVKECTFGKLTLELAEGIAVNSTAALDFSESQPRPIGNPTEGALLLWLHTNKYDYRRLKEASNTKNEIPFSTERKYMSTTVLSAVSNKEVTYTKGAPEIVFGMCDSSEIDEVTLKNILQKYQDSAYRTLGFAIDKHFVGVVAIEDPVREDVPAAVEECMKAGIMVKIVTGDTPGTAKQIGREIGLWTDADTDSNIITGAELAELSDEKLQECVLDLKIIARARPMDKKRLVEALQARNQVVAVTGDGTNDAPALHQAHVGLSMGAGTAVAKEASDITIIDNSFSSIGKAVMWGRSLYKNIQRFLLFQLTVNVTACCIVLVGALVGKDSPLTVTQMLWINLIMDTFGAMALASLPPSKEVMKDKPRKRGSEHIDEIGNWAYFKEQWRLGAFIINKPMLGEILSVGIFFFVLLFGFLLMFQHADINAMTDFLNIQFSGNGEVSPYEQTLLFSIFVWTHFFYLFNARAYETGESVLLNLFSKKFWSKGFWTIVCIIVFGQLLITEVMFKFFNVEPMLYNAEHPDGWLDLLIIIGFSSLVLWVREIWQLFKK